MAIPKNIARTVGCIVLLTMALGTATMQLALYCIRPMFADHFARGDRSLLWAWQGNPTIVFDDYGTGAKVDRKLNVIVVFADFYNNITDTDTERYSQIDFATSFRPCSTETWNGGRFVSVEGVEYLVPRRADRLFIFTRDGARREVVLPSGKATLFYEKLVEGSNNSRIREALKAVGLELDRPVQK